MKEKKNVDENSTSDSFIPEDTLGEIDLQSIMSDENIPQELKQFVKQLFGINIRNSSSFRGPIPPPEILKGYNEIIEDGAERIFSMAERQSQHRLNIEEFQIKEEFKQSKYGQIFGFILGLVGLGLSSILAILGHETTAGIFAASTIVGLVAVFVIGKKEMLKNHKEKNQK